MSEYLLITKLMEEADELEGVVQYKLENMCPLKGTAAKIEYLKNLCTKLDRVYARIEREVYEGEAYTLEDWLAVFNEEDLVVLEELKQAKAKVQKLEKYILGVITEEGLEELYELLEIR